MIQHWRTYLLLLFYGSIAGTTTAGELGFSESPPAEDRSVEVGGHYMVSYTDRIPGTDVTFEMIPISRGVLKIDDAEIAIAPLWVGRCEVTWGEFHAYMEMYDLFKTLGDLNRSIGAAAPQEHPAILHEYLKAQSSGVDSVTAPTPLYDPSFTYWVGDSDDQPAVTMTQFAARQYTKWLSGLTGREYRLPTEAEWEYAARAGTSTRYSFGEDDSELGDFAWYSENANEETHAVAGKKANPWGLHDMHGNVAEWVLDGYQTDWKDAVARVQQSGQPAVLWADKVHPMVYRGGCWYDDADGLTSAARFASSDPEWSIQDPNLPKSPWWFTEDPSTGIGFRIVRPVAPMDEDMRRHAWEPDTESLELDVADRIEEGRGVQGRPFETFLK